MTLSHISGRNLNQGDNSCHIHLGIGGPEFRFFFCVLVLNLCFTGCMEDALSSTVNEITQETLWLYRQEPHAHAACLSICHVAHLTLAAFGNGPTEVTPKPGCCMGEDVVTQTT